MNKIICFFQQLYTRLRASTPPFFKVIQWIGGIAAFITGLPTLLKSYNIVLPEAWQVLADKGVMIAGLVMVVVAKLPTNDQRVVNKFKQQQTPEQKEKAAGKGVI